jgi:SDR family mycofactocin-dependent oxidoreductase
MTHEVHVNGDRGLPSAPAKSHRSPRFCLTRRAPLFVLGSALRLSSTSDPCGDALRRGDEGEDGALGVYPAPYSTRLQGAVGLFWCGPVAIRGAAVPMGLTEGKVAFVTGGARGLGRAMAVRFAREGADVALLDVCRRVSGLKYPMSDREELEKAAQEVRSLGKRALPLVGDVRNSEEVSSAVEQAVKQFGKIDVVVANAGVSSVGKAWEISEDEWDTVIGVNLTGAWLTAKHTIPHLIKQHSGRLIFISSGAGLAGRSQLAHYCASKWGVIGMMKSLAIDLAPYRITVNAVCPASILTGLNTGMAKSMGIPIDELIGPWMKLQLIPEMIQPEDAAAAVVWIASEEARYVTGHALPVTAGAST